MVAILGELAALCLVVSGFFIMLGISFGYRLLMEFLEQLHVIAFIVAAVLIMFNINAGKRLLVGTLVLLVLVPIGLGLLKALLADLGEVVGEVPAPNGGGLVVGGLVLVLVLVAFIRYIIRRRRLQGILGRPQTSLKRRVDRS